MSDPHIPTYGKHAYTGQQLLQRQRSPNQTKPTHNLVFDSEQSVNFQRFCAHHQVGGQHALPIPYHLYELARGLQLLYAEEDDAVVKEVLRRLAKKVQAAPAVKSGARVPGGHWDFAIDGDVGALVEQAFDLWKQSLGEQDVADAKEASGEKEETRKKSKGKTDKSVAKKEETSNKSKGKTDKSVAEQEQTRNKAKVKTDKRVGEKARVVLEEGSPNTNPSSATAAAAAAVLSSSREEQMPKLPTPPVPALPIRVQQQPRSKKGKGRATASLDVVADPWLHQQQPQTGHHQQAPAAPATSRAPIRPSTSHTMSHADQEDDQEATYTNGVDRLHELRGQYSELSAAEKMLAQKIRELQLGS